MNPIRIYMDKQPGISCGWHDALEIMVGFHQAHVLFPAYLRVLKIPLSEYRPLIVNDDWDAMEARLQAKVAEARAKKKTVPALVLEILKPFKPTKRRGAAPSDVPSKGRPMHSRPGPSRPLEASP